MKLGGFILALVLVGGVLAVETEDRNLMTSVVVEVANGTADGATVVGDTVTLQIFQHRQMQNVLQATVGQNGEAVFANIPTGPRLSAVARVRHQNMTFQGLPITLAPSAGPQSTVVQVFDVSADRAALSVGTHHLTVAVQGSSLEVTEYIQLRNNSDKAVGGANRDAQDRPIVLEIDLPAGARDLTPLSFFEPQTLVATETGFYDTLAVPPGEHQVRFSYWIDIGRGALEIDKGITLPTSEFVVFWETGQGELTGLGEPDEQLTDAEGVPIQCYYRGDLRPGDHIVFQISGFNATTSDAETWIILVVAFGAIGVVALWRLRQGSTAPPSAQ